MKKYLLLFLIVIGYCYAASAQLEIHAAIGPSMPVGQYGNERLDEGGYAQVGVAAEINGFWFASERFGVQAAISFQGHDIDRRDLTRDFSQELFASSIDLLAGNYNTALAMIGPFYRFYPHDTDRFAWTFKGGVGMLFSRVDDLSVNVVSQTSQGPVNYTSGGQAESKGNFTYFLGSDMQYFLNPKRSWGIRFGIMFTHAKPNFGLVLPEEVAPEMTQNVSFVNVNAGISLRFGGNKNKEE
jgi:hypothetical protein